MARHVVDIASHVLEATHDVVLPPPWQAAGPSGAAYDTSAVATLVSHGVGIHHLQLARSAFSISNIASTTRLHTLIEDLQPDVVHCHSTIGGAVGRLAAARTEAPVVYTPNGIFTASVARNAERVLRPLTSRLVAVSPSEARNALNWGLCHPHQLTTIPNGIDLACNHGGPDLRSALGLAPEVPLVGTIMRLIRQKAPEQFIRVAEAVTRLHPRTQFVLIGMGPLQDMLDAEVAHKNLAGRFHQIPQLANASSVLGQLDVFVLPSRFEGAPYAPLEAMRAGTPVVLSDVAGNRDVVEHGVSGLLMPFGSDEAMARGVLSLLENPDVAREMTKAARKRLEARFDVRQMGAAITELYEEVATEGRRRKTRRLPQPRPSTSAHSFDSSAA